jgi:hypothetical protein
MFQVIVESLMSPPRALDLKAPKLEWSRIVTDQRCYSATIAKKLLLKIQNLFN